MDVLVVHPLLRAVGGAHSVAAWTMQALRGQARLTLLTWEAPDLDAVNGYYGTSLGSDDFQVETPPPSLRRLVEMVPGAGYLLRMSVLLRRCRQLDRQRRYDVLLSTFNEADLGRPGIQYIHSPGTLTGGTARSRSLPLQLGMNAYERLCAMVAGASPDGFRGNRTLVNSRFIRDQVRDRYRIDSEIVYPPVPGGFPDIGWDDRIDGFVWVSRFHPSKRLVEVVEILDRLRQLGHDLRLTVVGTSNHVGYERRVRELAAARSPWLTLHHSPVRSELVELIARHRYAIHAMIDEHFGIVVAEYLRAGCIPFVHASGGPLEIVGDDERIAFADRDDAVAKIDRMLRSPDLQQQVHAALRARRDLYSEQRFMDEIAAAVLVGVGSRL